MIGDALMFWVGTETVNPDSPAVQNLQRYTVPISAVILTGSVMVQGIRMMLSRKKDPLVAVAVDLILLRRRQRHRADHPRPGRARRGRPGPRPWSIRASTTTPSA